MTGCVVFQATYNNHGVSAAGYPYSANIDEYVVATKFGVAHFKVSKLKSGKTRIFTDLDTQPVPGWGTSSFSNLVKGHRLYRLTDRRVCKEGVYRLKEMPIISTDLFRVLADVLRLDEKAWNAWNYINGVNETAHVSEIFAHAEKNRCCLYERGNGRAYELMTTKDPMWGIY